MAIYKDINNIQSDIRFDFIYVDEESFVKYKPKSFKSLIGAFREYKS
jgi:type III restriction enzyme